MEARRGTLNFWSPTVAAMICKTVYDNAVARGRGITNLLFTQ